MTEITGTLRRRAGHIYGTTLTYFAISPFFFHSLLFNLYPKSVIKTRLNCFVFASSASLPTYALTSPIIRVFPRRSKSDACRSWLSFKAETRA